MPSQRKRITVTSLLTVCILLVAALCYAGPAATVTHLSGPLAVRKADGVTKALAVGSKVDEGDTVVTERRSYARLKFSDGSEVTLKPNTQFKVEQYAYDQANAGGDRGAFRLIKGGLRAITGQIGKRGDRDSYRMKTPTATIGIRGTSYDAHFCQGGGCGATIQPGLYLAVTDGSVVVTNETGVQTALQVKAGQHVYVRDAATAPVLLTTPPNIPFVLPQALGSTPAGGGASQGGGGADCQVR